MILVVLMGLFMFWFCEMLSVKNFLKRLVNVFMSCGIVCMVVFIEVMNVCFMLICCMLGL